MAVTVAQLGARVLRRLGIAAVPAGERPAAGASVPVADVASRTLQLLGVNPIDRAARPASDPFGHSGAYVATRTLQHLGVVAADETPSLADQAHALKAVIAAHEVLNALGLVAWVIDAIPYWALEHYVVMAAQFLAPAYGKPADMALFAAAQEAIRLEALSGARGQALAEAKVLSVHEALVAAGVADWSSAVIPAGLTEEYAALAAARLAPLYGKAFDAAGAEDRARRVVLLRRAPALAEEQVMAVHANFSARGKARWTVFDIPDYAERPYVILAANQLAPSFSLPADERTGQMAELELLRVIALPSAGGPVVGTYF